MWFCGVDIGTTHVKVIGITEAGTTLAPARMRTPTTERNGFSFHDGISIWRTVHDLVNLYASEAAASYGALGGMSVAAFGQEESIGVDAAGNPIYPSLAWWQVRSRPSLPTSGKEYFDSEDHYRISGLRHRPIQTPERVAFARQDDPVTFAKISRWVDFGSYVGYRLTGEWMTAANQLTHSQLFALTDLEPDPESFELLGIEPGLFAPVGFTGERVGSIKAAALPGVEVAPEAALWLGGHDQVVGALATRDGTEANAFDSIGTSEYVIVLGSRFAPTRRSFDLGVDIERGWGSTDLIYGFATPSGKILQLLARLLHGGDFDQLMNAAISDPIADPGFAVGITDFADNGTGLIDLTGIPSEATAVSITRSTFDQLAIRTRGVLMDMGRLAGADIEEVVLTGSLFRFEQMVEHRRQSWDIPLRVSRLSEPVAIGAAQIAAAGSGGEVS